MSLSRVPGAGSSLARSLQEEPAAAPCLRFEAVRGEDGALRDFTGTSLNAAAEALVRTFRLGRQHPLWTLPDSGSPPGLLDFAALARVVETGEPYSRDLRLRGGAGGEAWYRATAVKESDGFALWLAEAPPLRETEGALLEALAQEREARRGAEEALHVYDALLADAPVGMGLLDLDLQHRLVNPALAHMEGFAEGTALGASLAPHLQPVLVPLCRLALEVGGPVVAELTPETWSGVPMGGDWQVVAFPVGVAQEGGAHGVGLSLTDISERKRAERVLSAREEHLRLALETANMVAWEWTHERQRVSWSPRAEAFFGLEPGGLGDTLQRFLQCVHADDQEMVKEALERGQEAQGAYAFRFRGVWPSGRVRTYETTGQTFHDEDGRPARMVGVVLDCTERERAEEAMRASAERYRLASSATHDVLWELNLDTGSVYWGEAGTDVFGYRVEQVGHDLAWWRQQVHPEDRERASGSLHALLDSRADAWREEYRFRRADGEYIDVLDRGVVVRDERGKPLRMVGNMMDITERKRALDLMAQEAEFRERFIGILGHDLRNPLNAITLSAKTLQRRASLLPSDAKLAQRIESSAHRMGAMISDILDLTRARLAGGLPLHLAPVELHPVCRQVTEELATVHPQRRIHLELHGEAQGVWDGARLSQLLSNLVGNALEHSGPDADVTVRCSDAEGGQVVLQVHNPGPPIPNELLPSLFDPFRQAPSVRESGTRSSGLGLGLFVVREIARAHGGSVEVHSTREHGTTFRVRLPRDSRRATTPDPMLDA